MQSPQRDFTYDQGDRWMEEEISIFGRNNVSFLKHCSAKRQIEHLAAISELGVFFINQLVKTAMTEESAVVQIKPTAQPGIPGIVKLVPVLAIPLALPLVLHAVHGIAVGGIGVLAATLALGPKGKELIKSSGDVLYKMLPVAGKRGTGRENG